MDEAQKSLLVHTVVSGLPGANDGWTLDDVRLRIATYDGIGAELLRDNLIDFLSEVIPTAEKLGLRLCCHPDDPPFSLLGLPRVMSSQQDYKQVINAVDTIANGVTLCTGSLGVNADFDAAEFVHCFGPKSCRADEHNIAFERVDLRAHRVDFRRLDAHAKREISFKSKLVEIAQRDHINVSGI